jgi:hypothetical protein
MGKTVPSYRIALEWEIQRWKPFAEALNSQDRETFEVLMDMCRNNSMASGAACNPIVFEPMIMSMLLAHQKKIDEIEGKFSQQEEKVNIITAKTVGLTVIEK